MGEDFFGQVKQFNKVFGLPLPPRPTFEGEERLLQFGNMLSEEVREMDDIPMIADNRNNELDVLVSLADWLGDVIVYCTSEAMRHGIPIEDVLRIIMGSNMSKLDEMGLPIVRDGKVQKGPNYYKPEPHIRALLEERMTK